MFALDNRVVGAALALSICCGAAWSQSLPGGAAAVVNGKAITQTQVDLAVSEATARGVRDTPAVRQAIVNDLVGAELLAQRAKQLGLADDALVAARLESMQTNMLARELQRFWVEKNPASQADMRAEYKRQVDELNKRGPLNEFDVAHIVVPTEAAALDLIAKLSSGADFAELATANSIDPSRERGGDMGWVLPFNILPEIGNVVANLGAGAVTQAPIQTRLGWHVVKVKTKRAYTIPTFEASEQALTQAVQNAKWAAYLKDLADKAAVVR